MDLLEKNGLIPSSLISQILIDLGLGENLFLSYMDSRRGRDRAWYEPQVCSGRRKCEDESWKVLVKWSEKDW